MMTSFRRVLVLFLIGMGASGLVLAASSSEAELISVKMIWEGAPHNAFTDLVRHRGEWFCVFREGSAHVSPDGALQVLASKDGERWSSVARLRAPDADLRDAKISVTPDDQLMLSGAGAMHPPSEAKHRSLAWFSRDGRKWTEPLIIGDPNQWLWRVTWHKGIAYSVGYETKGENFVRLYTSRNGRDFTTSVARLYDDGQPNEASLLFQPDDTALCLLRRDGKAATAKLGRSRPPYTNWEWKDLGMKLGGPQLLRLPDGRWIAAGRLYNGGARTSLCWLDPGAGRLTEFLKLPSGGDTSYPGLVWQDRLLWISYYSSHEGKACIYLAKVKLPKKS